MLKIAVVGAGPSGASAGYHLAKNGHHVTLMDKESFPRDKVCGDGISPKSIEALLKMGIDSEYIKAFTSKFYLCNGAIINVYNKQYYYQGIDFGFCMPRYIFDNMIYQRAIDAGCIPHQQSVSNISKFSSNFKNEFDYIIDARGVLAGECNAIAIREYWNLPLKYFPSNFHSNLQIYFDPELRIDGYFLDFSSVFK